MRTLIRIICCGACLFVGYMATMAWVNLSEGKDAFASTPLEGKVNSELKKKAVDFTSEQLEKLSQDAKEKEVIKLKTPEPQKEENPIVTLPKEEVKLVETQKVKPTTEDALEKLWGVDKEKSTQGTVNTSSSSTSADTSLMNSLERLMN